MVLSKQQQQQHITSSVPKDKSSSILALAGPHTALAQTVPALLSPLRMSSHCNTTHELLHDYIKTTERNGHISYRLMLQACLTILVLAHKQLYRSEIHGTAQLGSRKCAMLKDGTESIN